MRRFDAPPETGIYYRHRPGAYGIFWHGARILITHQADGQNEWQLPGGGIDAGESPIAALHREAFEETGWRVAINRRVTSFRRYIFMPDYGYHADKVCHVYTGRAILRLGVPCEPGHVAGLVDPAWALAHLSVAGDRYALRKLIGYPR